MFTAKKLNTRTRITLVAHAYKSANPKNQTIPGKAASASIPDYLKYPGEDEYA